MTITLTHRWMRLSSSMERCLWRLGLGVESAIGGEV
jgi:hypothetical protein